MGVEDKHILGKVPEKINLVTKFFSFSLVENILNAWKPIPVDKLLFLI
jgi:hypothetical protein